MDLSPEYKPTKFVVPETWRGSGPFVVAKPSDSEIRANWWEVFNDPILNRLEEQAMRENPDLQAAAERFMQSRYEMMKVRSGYLPKIGARAEASENKQSENALFRSSQSPIRDNTLLFGAGATWEPDFWSSIRNSTKVEIFKAQEYAAKFGLVKLLLAAEVADQYYALRGLDLQNAIYKQSIAFYKMSLEIINSRFVGKLSSLLDVARAKYQLANTEAKQLDVEADRQVVEHALATLLNRNASVFKVDRSDAFDVVRIQVPKSLPSTLLERRPDIAALERRMAQANKTIGIARAAFFPNIKLGIGGGYEKGSFLNLFNIANSLWSFGGSVDLPLFQAGYRRAQLKQSWSVYRETLNDYRSGVLNAFREVENSLSKINLLGQELVKQADAVSAALQTQDLSMNLFKGGLASSLDLLYAQVATLDARIREAEIKASFMRRSVALVKDLGGGWKRENLPKVDEIQPMGTLQYTGLKRPTPAGGIAKSQPVKFSNISGTGDNGGAAGEADNEADVDN